MSTNKIVPVLLTRFNFVEPKTTTVSVKSNLTGKKASEKKQTPFSANIGFELVDKKARELFKDLPGFSDKQQEGEISYSISTPEGNILVDGYYYTPKQVWVTKCVGREYVPEGRGWTDNLEPAHYEDKYEDVLETRPENHSQSLEIKNPEQFYELIKLLSKLAKSDNRVTESNKDEIGALRKILLDAGRQFISDVISLKKENLANLGDRLKQKLEAVEQKRKKLEAK